MLASTQDEARRLLAEGSASAGDVILADRQTAGRGRFGRRWMSPAGGLYATFILEARPLPSIHAGLAVARAMGSLGLAVDLKWPNDVLVREEKLGGILVEAAGHHILVGVGVNLTASPLPGATSAQARGVAIDRDALLEAIGQELAERRSARRTIAAYRRACTTIGRIVRVESAGGGGMVEGVAEDVDEEGRLRLRTENGVRVIASGECAHLRPPEEGRRAVDAWGAGD